MIITSDATACDDPLWRMPASQLQQISFNYFHLVVTCAANYTRFNYLICLNAALTTPGGTFLPKLKFTTTICKQFSKELVSK